MLDDELEHLLRGWAQWRTVQGLHAAIVDQDQLSGREVIERYNALQCAYRQVASYD